MAPRNMHIGKPRGVLLLLRNLYLDKKARWDKEPDSSAKAAVLRSVERSILQIDEALEKD